MAEYYGPPEADERSELMMDFGGTGFLIICTSCFKMMSGRCQTYPNALENE